VMRDSDDVASGVGGADEPDVPACLPVKEDAAMPDDAPSTRSANPPTPERRRPTPGTPRGYLDAVPTTVMLDRLPVAILAVHRNGTIVYTNPAFEELLGYAGLVDRFITPLVPGCINAAAAVDRLRGAHGAIVELRHAEGRKIEILVGASAFLRADDPVVLIAMHDVTEQLWSHGTIADTDAYRQPRTDARGHGD